MKLCSVLLVLMLVVSMVSPAAAVTTYRETGITSFDVEAPKNGVIATVNLDNIPANFVANVEFDAYGEIYLFEIVNTRPELLGVPTGYWIYDISLTYPNSTVATATLKSFQPLATDTDIKIQYFGQRELDAIWDVDVYVGLLPLTASFVRPYSNPDAVGENFPENLLYTRLAFSRVSGTCTQPVDFKAYISTEEEFKKQQAEDLAYSIKESFELFFSWTWDAILTFVEMIPGVGPYFAMTIELVVVLVDDLFFYIKLFFIDYLETTLLTLEFFILADALINVSKRASIMTFVERIVSNHVKVITFVGGVILAAVSLVPMIVETVTRIVDALKPT